MAGRSGQGKASPGKDDQGGAPRPRAPSRAPVRGGKRSGRGKGKGSLIPVVLALVLPIGAVAGYVGYRTVPAVQNLVDGLIRVVNPAPSDSPGSLTEGGDGASEEAHGSSARPVSEDPARSDPSLWAPAGSEPPQPDPVQPDPAMVPPGNSGSDSDVRPAPSSAEKTPLPRQTPAKPRVREGSVGVKAAAELAAGVFDGEAGVRESAPHASWYGFRLKEGKPRPPFKVQPTQVDVSTRAWKGRFMQDESGFVIPMRATDPLGPQEISTYVGAVLFSGTPAKAGKVRGLLALEAAAGEVTRLEALDFDGDGVLELVMEVETHAAGGYLLRDLVVASFLHRPAKILWSARTLDDGPGALVEEATFRQVTFRENPDTGKTDIHEEEGTRRYRIQKDLTRTRTEERIVNRRTHRLEGSRFRVAGSAEKVRR